MARLVVRELGELAETELGVARGRLAARRRSSRRARQEDAQQRGLQLVEPRVVADEVEVLLVPRAVEREDLDAVGELRRRSSRRGRRRRGEEVLGRDRS